MKRNIDVTITVEENGNVTFEFFEAESGDFSRICTTAQNAYEEEKRIGTELMAWADLMMDGMTQAV